MSSHDDDRPHEIVIIRRSSNSDEEAHHGGVWKVAFADFMTAMMAFFLVLWIVNSTTRETKTSLARYFNPIKLTESSAAKKGVTDSKDHQEEENVDAKQDHDKKVEKAKAKRAENSAEDAKSERKSDPGHVDQERGHEPVVASNFDAAAQQVRPIRQNGNATGAEPLSEMREPNAFVDPFERRAWRNASEGVERQATDRGESEGLLREIGGALSDLKKDIGPHVEVKADPDGVLISLSEGFDFLMFSVGSAEPQAGLARALGAIAATLKTRPGAIIIRGHTDSRRYRGKGYDNWSLSSARAHAAFQILMHSGLDSTRLERIEGYADHKPRKVDDPLAPENRRIEIFLRRRQA